jgi:hypothetical protein
MDFDIWAYPLAIIADRYQGTYSGGAWLAIAGIEDPNLGRLALDLLADRVRDAPNPWGEDLMAMEFWEAPPSWIAAGATPDEAIAALKRKNGFE